ncbi:site-specific integrase [uncultured Desulfosarcina sp.]|uniref:tyrosine-type recombinase/integrase n=1 Tax=uncultured Desulfosarcina sp. TaxID=218289 RepID=UPI0029C6A307|nr:site-specific integrase [uncultured Desulfosarcina sp.]
MPSLIKVRNGSQVYRATVMVKGTRKDKLFSDSSKDSFRAAAEWERDTKKELQEQIVIPAIPTVSLSIDTWLQEYLDDAKLRYVKKTYQEKKGAFDRMAKQPEIQADTPVENLTVKICREFLAKQFKDRSGYAANKDRKNLSTAWKWGRANFPDWPLSKNPFQQISKFPETRQARYVPPEDDFWKVYDVSNGQDRVMLLALLHLAARKSEVFRLTIHDLDFKNSQIRLRTRKRLGGHLEENWIPMTSRLKTALVEWIKKRMAISGIDRQHVFICLDDKPFCNPYYGQPFKQRRHLMARLCKAAKVQHFGFHAIRHLTASTLYQAGEPVAVIQDILRHKSPNTTERYLHRMFGNDRSREALERLNGPAEVITITNKKAVSD